jgi:hypothetical protein
MMNAIDREELPKQARNERALNGYKLELSVSGRSAHFRLSYTDDTENVVKDLDGRPGYFPGLCRSQQELRLQEGDDGHTGSTIQQKVQSNRLCQQKSAQVS